MQPGSSPRSTAGALHQRFGRHARRALLATRGIAVATAMGVVGTLAPSVPAAAAPAPTISAPASRIGYGTVTLSGTARPGARVYLYESAISINDMQPADDWEHGGGAVTVSANSRGAWRIVRYVDTGFLFAVQSDGHISSRRKVLVRVLPTMWVTSTRTGVVSAHVEVSPNEPGLTVRFQRANSNGSWTTLASGVTDSSGAYARLLTGQAAGTTKTYRAFVAADPTNGILQNYSAAHKVWVHN